MSKVELKAEDLAQVMALKTGYDGPTGSGWWGFHHLALSHLLDAAREEGRKEAEAELAVLEDRLLAVEKVLTARDEPEDYNPTLLQRAQDTMRAYELNQNIAALSDHRPPVEGWVTVPVEPTAEMLRAGIDEVMLASMSPGVPWLPRVYAATIAAAPPSPPVEALGAREAGQAEGFAAAVTWLRDRAAMHPPASLWHAAGLLADQLEASRIALSTAPLSLGGEASEPQAANADGQP